MVSEMDGRPVCHGDVFIPDELVSFDLQQLPLTLHMKGLEGSGIGGEETKFRLRIITRTTPGHGKYAHFVVSERRWFFQMCWSDDS